LHAIPQLLIDDLQLRRAPGDQFVRVIEMQHAPSGDRVLGAAAAAPISTPMQV
jgi:hypothetical protein